jgi:hypothetical protein
MSPQRSLFCRSCLIMTARESSILPPPQFMALHRSFLSPRRPSLWLQVLMAGLRSWRKLSFLICVMVSLVPCHHSGVTLNDDRAAEPLRWRAIALRYFKYVLHRSRSRYEVEVLIANEQSCWCPSVWTYRRGSLWPSRQPPSLVSPYGCRPCERPQATSVWQKLSNSVSFSIPVIVWQSG